MNKPYFNSVSISPSSTTTKAAVSITVDVIDKEVVFSSAYYYARSSNVEIMAGEEVGIL